METSEIAVFGVPFKAFDRARSSVDGRLIAPFRVLQLEEIACLDALVFEVAFDHVFQTSL